MADDDFKVDDPVMVRAVGGNWYKRHFAGTSPTGKLMCFNNGGTSWTTSVKVFWNECRRPTEEELATPSNKDEWIEWKGGECPVDEDTTVRVKMLDGYITPVTEKAGALRWVRSGSQGDITAYKVVIEWDKPGSS